MALDRERRVERHSPDVGLAVIRVTIAVLVLVGLGSWLTGMLGQATTDESLMYASMLISPVLAVGMALALGLVLLALAAMRLVPIDVPTGCGILVIGVVVALISYAALWLAFAVAASLLPGLGTTWVVAGFTSLAPILCGVGAILALVRLTGARLSAGSAGDGRAMPAGGLGMSRRREAATVSVALLLLWAGAGGPPLLAAVGLLGLGLLWLGGRATARQASGPGRSPSDE